MFWYFFDSVSFPNFAKISMVPIKICSSICEGFSVLVIVFRKSLNLCCFEGHCFLFERLAMQGVKVLFFFLVQNSKLFFRWFLVLWVPFLKTFFETIELWFCTHTLYACKFHWTFLNRRRLHKKWICKIALFNFSNGKFRQCWSDYFKITSVRFPYPYAYRAFVYFHFSRPLCCLSLFCTEKRFRFFV